MLLVLHASCSLTGHRPRCWRRVSLANPSQPKLAAAAHRCLRLRQLLLVNLLARQALHLLLICRAAVWERGQGPKWHQSSVQSMMGSMQHMWEACSCAAHMQRKVGLALQQLESTSCGALAGLHATKQGTVAHAQLAAHSNRPSPGMPAMPGCCAGTSSSAKASSSTEGASAAGASSPSSSNTAGASPAGTSSAGGSSTSISAGSATCKGRRAGGHGAAVARMSAKRAAERSNQTSCWTHSDAPTHLLACHPYC